MALPILEKGWECVVCDPNFVERTGWWRLEGGQWEGPSEGSEYVAEWLTPNGVRLYAKEVNCGWGAISATHGTFWGKSPYQVRVLSKDGHRIFVRVKRNRLRLLGAPWECIDKAADFGVWIWIKSPKYTYNDFEGEGFELSIFLDETSQFPLPIGTIKTNFRQTEQISWIQLAWIYDRIGSDGTLKSYEIDLTPLFEWIEMNIDVDLKDCKIVEVEALAEAHYGEVECEFYNLVYLRRTHQKFS